MEIHNRNNIKLLDGWVEHEFLSDNDIEHIYTIAENYNYNDGMVQNKNLEMLEQYRKSSVKWIQLGSELTNKISDLIVRTNKNMWNFNISSLPDNFQFTRYDGNGGHYENHLDIGDGVLSYRKISVVCGISKQSSYEGGEFSIYGESSNFKLEYRSILLFPSFLLHKVYPVTSGTRYSLVNWVEGEPFR